MKSLCSKASHTYLELLPWSTITRHSFYLLDHSLCNRRGQVSCFAERNRSFETKVINLCFYCTDQITEPSGFNSLICKKTLWKFFPNTCLLQGSANYGPQAKWGLPSNFINKALLKDNHALLDLCTASSQLVLFNCFMFSWLPFFCNLLTLQLLA